MLVEGFILLTLEHELILLDRSQSISKHTRRPYHGWNQLHGSQETLRDNFAIVAVPEPLTQSLTRRWSALTATSWHGSTIMNVAARLDCCLLLISVYLHQGGSQPNPFGLWWS